MGMVMKTNNPNSFISDAQRYVPGWDTTGLRRAEMFAFQPAIGGNLMPGENSSVAIASPALIAGTPWAELTSYGSDVPHLRLGIPDSSVMTWLCLFDPANSTFQRLVMSSYAGTSAANRPGVSIVVDATGKLGMYVGRLNPATGAYSTQWIDLPQFVSGKPMLLAVTLDNKTCTIKDLTNGISNTKTLTDEYERSFGSEIYVGKGVVSSWGNVSGKNRIASYMVFERLLSDDELAEIRSYLLRCFRLKYPDMTF